MNDGRLVALIDNVPLDPEAGRALWTEFSAHMDANQGDMAGFAKAKGWVSVTPEYRQGKAVLVVKTGAAVQGRDPKPRPRAKIPPAKSKRKPPA